MEAIFSLGEYCLRKARMDRKYEAAKTYRTVLHHLECFAGRRELRFSELTRAFLLDFDRYLADRRCCHNTCLLYLSYLQTLHRKAADRGITPAPGNLYDTVLTAPEESEKRSVSVDVLWTIREATLPNRYQHLCFARDMFMLSFYLRGIPFIDLAHLRHTDMKNNMLHYNRSKTGKALTVTLEPHVLSIIYRWKNSVDSSSYLLPIIKCPGSDEDERRQYNSALRLYNKHLSFLPIAIGLSEEVRLTSYTPRHTWAMLAHEEGIEVPLISEALSHSSEKTTRHYISSFTVDKLAAVNRRVVGVLDKQGDIIREAAGGDRQNSSGCIPVL